MDTYKMFVEKYIIHDSLFKNTHVITTKIYNNTNVILMSTKITIFYFLVRNFQTIKKVNYFKKIN